MATPFAGDYPAIESLISHLDEYLRREHPSWFGNKAQHPVLPVKRSKIVHDNLWGTNRFSWRELVIIDSPLLQRLRDIHQVGLAFQIYPSAHHTRFDHCLGVVTIAGRVFDSLLNRDRGQLRDIAGALYPGVDREVTLAKFRQELRLAALLHDTGHSLFSHASERVYSNIGLLQKAATELRNITGKKKGAGEALSFCLALTPSVAALIERPKERLTGATSSEDYDGPVDLVNVALLLVGKSSHPFLQFMGDIVSSGFDADKLDYLLRDAKAAGLPLQYDLDRYLFAVEFQKDHLADGAGYLEKLYGKVAPSKAVRKPAATGDFPYYDTHRLRLPRKAMNAIEQIVICKLMLYSYIYHHPKVRAAEGTLSLMLDRQVRVWRNDGENDQQIVERFLTMTDAALRSPAFTNSNDKIVQNYSYRIANRLLPREVLKISVAAASGSDATHVSAFVDQLQEESGQPGQLTTFEKALAVELRAVDSSLSGNDEDVLRTAGVWIDIPSAVKFEDVDKMVVRSGEGEGVELTHLFPIRQWTEAYQHYRYFVRLFAFSEYHERVAKAAKKAIKTVAKIENDQFAEGIIRKR